MIVFTEERRKELGVKLGRMELRLAGLCGSVFFVVKTSCDLGVNGESRNYWVFGPAQMIVMID